MIMNAQVVKSFKKQNTFKWVLWLALSLVLLFLTQAPGYRFEVIGWDESTFILSSADILNGNLPFIHTYDTKPHVLYLTIASGLYLFGHTLGAVRLTGDICILLTALFIYLILKKQTNYLISLVGSGSFISMTSVNYAQYTSAEIIAIFYLTVAVWILLNFEIGNMSSFFAGLLMSFTILVRTNLVITAMAGALLYVLYVKKTGVRKAVQSLLNYIIGGILPFLFIFIVYYLNGSIKYLIMGMFEIPLSYSSDRLPFVQTVIKNIMLWKEYASTLPFLIAPLSLILLILMLVWVFNLFKMILNRQQVLSDQSVRIIFLLALSLATLYSIVISGGVYKHYQIQLFSLFIILTMLLIHGLTYKKVQKIITISIMILFLFNLTKLNSAMDVARNYGDISNNYPGVIIAREIDDLVGLNDEVLALKTHIVLFYLNKNPILPILTHPSSFGKESYLRIYRKYKLLDKDPLDLVISKKPKIILISPDLDVYFFNEQQKDKMVQLIKSEYKLLDIVDDTAVYYRED